MIALRSEFAGRESSIYDRPGSDEVARLKETTARTVEAIDTPTDLLADILTDQLRAYDGPLPANRAELNVFVLQQFRTAAGPTAISAMIEQFVEEDQAERGANTIRRMLCLIRSQARPALTCDAIAIAMGVHISEGRSLEEIAKAHGITKQALSKRTIRICEELGFMPSVLMRSQDSRESYRLKQRQRHAAARAAGMGDGTISNLRAKLAAAREKVSGSALRASA